MTDPQSIQTAGGAERYSPQLATSFEVDGDRVRFVIVNADRLVQDRLAALGYLGVGDGRSATRWFRRSAELERCYERFAASIDEMVRQNARAARAPWESALLEFLARVEGTALDWWIYGSAALAVRGMPIEPGDVDVHVDDAMLAGRIFADLLVTPVEHMRGWVARYAGRAFCGAIIEWLAEPHAEQDDPSAPHEQGPFIAPQIETVQWRGHLVCVPPPAAQLRVCETRGLTHRAELIRSALPRG